MLSNAKKHSREDDRMPPDALSQETLATAAPSTAQRIFAGLLCAGFLVATSRLWAEAASPAPAMPGFVPTYQTALIVVYGLTTYLFYSQYRRAGAISLLILAAGSLYTTLIVVLQLGSFPAVLVAGRIVGAGPDTTTWFWSFWHLGPPLFALCFALLEERQRPADLGPAAIRIRGWFATSVTLALVVATAILCTRYVHLLPKSVEGDDYTLLTTTGIGPAILALTVLALLVLCWRTRLRSVLQLWLAVSLVLLICDNGLTMVGAARGTVGWVAGRLEALLAGVVLLSVYLRETTALYMRAGRLAVERERARAELETARDNLAIALAAAEMGDWEMNFATGTSRRTLRHDQIFGYETLLPAWDRASFLSHVAEEDRSRADAAFEAAGTAGRLDFECRIERRGDGAERWIAVRGRAYRNEAGDVGSMAGIVMDTTEAHRLRDRLRRAERMEAVGQLTGGVAHDFNNLLTVIVGNADILSHKADNPERVRRAAQMIAMAAQRGSEITGQLLAFSRRQVTRPETLNPNKVLREFRPLLERGASGAVQVTFDLDAEIDPVRLDPGQFEAAVLNLVVNARDALPDGGSVKISSRNVILLAADLGDAPELAPGSYVSVTVTDDGVGMDEATAEKVFEPFFTTKEVGQGTGLGLSQVYGFARQSGGYVRLQSALGLGTTVEMLLPPSRDRVAIERPSTDIVPLRRAINGEVVLVVEDEATVLELAIESLHGLGYRTLAAANAAAALEQLRGEERIDVLFSDVIMPGGMNGVQLSVEARRLRPGLKVLLTSGYTGSGEARNFPQDVPLLPKPYDRGQLASRLQLVMERAAA